MDEEAQRAYEEVPPQRRERIVADLVKKVLLSGIGAVFTTEEGIRSYLGELKLPKDAAQFVLNQVTKTKEDLFRVVTQEVRSFLEQTKLDDVLRSVLTTISLEISTKVRFVDERGRLEPRARSKVRLRTRSDRRDEKEVLAGVEDNVEDNIEDSVEDKVEGKVGTVDPE